MNSYCLNAWLPARGYDVQEHNFEFVAPDDISARFMVGIFSKVCHPLSHGPLYRIGKTDTRDGIKGIYPLSEPQLVPLDVLELPQVRIGLPREIEMTKEQWFLLPLDLRQRWWRDTDYGKRAPTQEMIEEIRRALAETPHD